MYRQIYLDYFGNIDESMKNFTEQDFLEIIKELLSSLDINK